MSERDHLANFALFKIRELTILFEKTGDLSVLDLIGAYRQMFEEMWPEHRKFDWKQEGF